MPRRLRRSLCNLLAAAAAVTLAGAPPPEEPELARSVAVSGELKVAIAAGDVVYLFAKPLPGETMADFAKRFSDDPATRKKILALPLSSGRLKPGAFVRVPFDLLSDNFRKIALQALFPEDSGSSAGWTHVVTAPSGSPESLWRIAEWFTGDGANYARLRKENGLASLVTEAGQRVRIPVDLLRPAFRTEAAANEAPPPPALAFGRDEKGAYAAYALRKGEALYSAVVVRFTGRIHAEDVNAEADNIARRNGIADVHSIPVGYAVRIPVEDLLPEYREPEDPARIEYERSRLETAQFVNRIQAVRLAGVTVILDPGHGGRDTGALVEGVAEARYVYDVAARVGELLRKNTRARVIFTVDDRNVRGVPDRDRLAFSSGGQVMTTPPYPIDDTVPGVHLRWYLANAILHGFVENGGEPARVVFLSIHADSLHPSVRGAMAYIPGEKFLGGSFGKSGGVYEARREYRQAPRVSFDRRQRLEAEGVSRELAETLIATFRRRGLAVHPFNPVRENVVRTGRAWVPAVLRYNRVPARVLLEVCNLNNEEDRRFVETRDYRERLARGIVEALGAYYGGPAKARRKTVR